MLPFMNKAPAPSAPVSVPFHLDILAPVLVLLAHTMAVFVLLFVYRIPEMLRKKVNVAKLALKGSPEYQKEMSKMDPKVRSCNPIAPIAPLTLLPVPPFQLNFPADNYNHLCEQPTLFYAAVFFIYLFRDGVFRHDVVLINCAWTYTVTRIFHSLEQCFRNDVNTRFAIFAVSSLALLVMVGKVVASTLLP